MKRRSKRIAVVAGIIMVPVGIVLGLMLFVTLTVYRPRVKEILTVRGTGIPMPGSTRTFSFMTWNIGYGGLGKKMDFFYENGKRVRPVQEEFSEYFKEIKKFLAASDSVDVVFLQEIDIHAKRSYFTDEVEELSKVLPSRSYLFAKNYDCRFVPLPLDAPIGRVISGISCFSRYVPRLAERIDFGTEFPWPKQLFFLKRCFIVMRFALEEGEELVVINTHNSTFDKEGKLRKKELLLLKSYMMAEYSKGNYVITGGDWNNNPPGFNPQAIRSGDLVKTVDPPINPYLFQGWQVAFDSSAPSNRNVDMPYKKGQTRTTIIDFFIVSPNIAITNVKTIPTRFSCSDHQPVVMKITLK
jgi:endonuclease/exonuclease/phosphatase family metal-dependent hydrolase